MRRQYWYDEYDWQADPGYYRVVLQMPGSNEKSYRRQLADLAAFGGGRWQPAPVTVAVTALLVHLAATGWNPRQAFYRCAEEAEAGCVDIAVVAGRVRVATELGHLPIVNTWLAVAQKGVP